MIANEFQAERNCVYLNLLIFISETIVASLFEVFSSEILFSEISYNLLQCIPEHEKQRIQKLFESIPPGQRNAIAQRESIRKSQKL